MARRTIHTSGFRELDDKLEMLGKSMATKAGNKAVRRGAVLGARTIRNAAPRDEGDLKRNIRARKGRSRSRDAITYLITTGNAFYAAFLEFGTRKMAAKPFFKPALDSIADGALKEMADELKAAIERIARGGKP